MDKKGKANFFFIPILRWELPIWAARSPDWNSSNDYKLTFLVPNIFPKNSWNAL